MRSLLSTIQFLTRLPVPGAGPAAANRPHALLWYPWVGGIIGALATALAWPLALTDPLLAGSAWVVAMLWLSGGLHLDGLADTADAWVGGLGDPDRTLTIMKDPRCGPAGVTAIVGLLLLKLAACVVLVRTQQWLLLIWAPALSRSAAPLLFATTAYVRQGGLGSSLVTTRRSPALALSLCGVFLVSALLGPHGLLMLLLSGTVCLFLRRQFVHRIGGITGDTVGAAIELVETTALFLAAALPAMAFS